MKTDKVAAFSRFSSNCPTLRVYCWNYETFAKKLLFHR